MQASQSDHRHSGLSLNQTHASGGTLPPPASYTPSHQGSRLSTPNYQQQLPFPPIIHSQRVNNYGATASPGHDNLPHPPLFDGLPSRTVGRPMQYSQMYFQMQTLRQQNQAHDVEVARQNASRNGMGPSPAPRPFGASGPLTRGFDQTQGHFSIVSKPQISCTF